MEDTTNIFETITSELHDDPVALASFNEGLSKHYHFLQSGDAAALKSFLTYVQGWLSRVMAARDDLLMRSFAETDAAIDQGESLGPAMSGPELASLIRQA